MISRKCPTCRLFVPRSIRPAVLRWSPASRLVAHPGIRGTLCVTISLCVLLDFFVRLLYYTAILTALFLMTTATLLCLIKYCPVLSSQVESCRVSDLFSAQSPSCLRPMVRLPCLDCTSVEVAAPAGTALSLVQVKSASMFQFMSLYYFPVERMPDLVGKQQTA